uniref:Uncharacterized protein n=1 Tax=Macaca nemestrina TaxID=9545 RepID=A0A2K6CGG5_MACNE
MLTSRRRSCGSPDTRKVRSSTQKKRNMRLQSSKFYQKSKLFLSSRATCDLCLP